MSRYCGSVSGLIIWSTLLTGCNDSLQTPQGSEGDLVVHVAFEGLLPSRTVQIIVDDTTPLAVEGPSNAAPLFALATTRLPFGSHRVRLTGLDPNCETPNPEDIQLTSSLPAFVTFIVQCRDDLALAGRGLAWIDDEDDAWGNSMLYLRKENGEVITPFVGNYIKDAAWSGRGDALAVLRADQPNVAFVAPDGRMLPWGGISTLRGAAIAWVPGQEQLSVLELSESCGILLVKPGATVADQTLSCGETEGIANRSAGNLAWSPDGLTAAVGVGLEPAVRLVNRESGVIVKRFLPGEHVPGPLEWSPNGSLFVLADCVKACNGTRILLLRYDPVSEAWNTLTTWKPLSGNAGSRTLEMLDPGHLAVGMIEGSTHVVSLDVPAESRVFLAQTGSRLSRRP